MVGVVGADRGDDGDDRAAGDAAAQLRRRACCGALLAGGTLGILIPPSVMAIVYAVVAQQSLGELLVGSVFPGFLLSGMYIGYVTIRCYINPTLGPALPLEERVELPREAAAAAPHDHADLLIMLVLGVIFFGIATPVEAAGIGTFGALHRLRRCTAASPGPPSARPPLATLKATAMVMWIFFGATMFVGFFILKGGQTFVAELDPRHRPAALRHPAPDDGDPVRPRHVPRLGRHPAAHRADLPADPEGPAFDRPAAACPGVAPADVRLWYGVIFMVNMQMAFLSPPFGYSLFYLKSVAPPQITHGDDLPLGHAVHLPAGDRGRPLHRLPRDSSSGCRASSTPAADPPERPGAARRQAPRTTAPLPARGRGCFMAARAADPIPTQPETSVRLERVPFLGCIYHPEGVMMVRCYFFDRTGRIQTVELMDGTYLDRAVDRATAILALRAHLHSFEIWDRAERLVRRRRASPAARAG